MTSEVVLANGFGVVVAADTATTTGGKRTYDGAIKLQGLAQPHAIAVLHAGSVLIHGIPYQTHIENWSRSLPDKAFNKVAEYALSFKAFLKESIADNQPEQDLLRDYLGDFEERVHRIRHALDYDDALTAGGITKYFDRRLERYGKKAQRKQNPFSEAIFLELGLNSPKNSLEEECRNEGCPDLRHSSIEGVIEKILGEFLDDRSRKACMEWVKLWLGDFYPTSKSATVIFTGYGQKDFVPACISLNIEAMVLDRLFCLEGDAMTARRFRANGGYSLLATYGMDDEISRFLKEAGLHSQYPHSVVSDSLRDFQATDQSSNDSDRPQSPDQESTPQEPSTREQLTRAEAEINMNLAEIEDNNMLRFQSVISGMNLKNLGSIATRLVQLQNLALDLRGELPVVGANVVLGVVTKTDGFYCVDPMTGERLNQRFVS